MISFRQIEANRVRTQEQRFETKLAKDDGGPHAVPARRTAETVVVALEGMKTIKHSRQLSSRITTLETCGGVRAGALACIAVVAPASCHHQIDRLNARTKLLQYWK
jgi:hypothetical protein